LLYDLGLDMRGTVVSEKPRLGASTLSLDRPPMLPLLQFDTKYEVRRKSVVRSPKRAPARVGRLSTLGSSIGCSSGQRRKSSVASNHSAHARYVDNVNRPSNSREGTWSKVRPPTPVARLPQRSPSSLEDSSSDSDDDLPSMSRPRHSGVVDRMSLIMDASPPQPKPDHVSIYEMLTGATNAERSHEEPIGPDPDMFAGEVRERAPEWMGGSLINRRSSDWHR
jgi:hypothetical protein